MILHNSVLDDGKDCNTNLKSDYLTVSHSKLHCVLILMGMLRLFHYYLCQTLLRFYNSLRKLYYMFNCIFNWLESQDYYLCSITKLSMFSTVQMRPYATHWLTNRSISILTARLVCRVQILDFYVHDILNDTFYGDLAITIFKIF